MRTITALLFIAIASATAAETPKLIGRVNDHAGVLTAAERATLERKLEAIEQTEGHPQVAVLLPASMDGLDIERYANDTFRAWKLGQTGKDNGILVVIAPKERKWRIEVAYGLEGVIPDSRAKAIIANDMDPHLKGGKTGFYAALDAAVSSIAVELAKERSAPSAPSGSLMWLILVVIGGGGLIVAGTAWLSGHQNRKNERERAERLNAAARERPRYVNNPMAGAVLGAAIGGGMGAGIAAASMSRAQRPEPTPRPKPKPRDDTPSRSYSSSSDSGSSSSWSSSSSSDSSSSSSSFSGGGGDSGGGGASGGD